MRKPISVSALIALALLVLPLALSRVLAAPSADFNGDGTVDFADFALFAGAFGTSRDDTGYDAKYDLDGNGEIGFTDLLHFAKDFGKVVPPPASDDSPFALKWNNIPRQQWWRPSAPYSCAAVEKTSSPWIEAGLQDVGGSDPLSLIRYYGNGSYLRYLDQAFDGCTPMTRYPDRTHLDPPADPTYYSLGDLDIWIDIGRIPSDLRVRDRDDGSRVAMSMAEAVNLMNTHVAHYFRRVSKGRFRVTFRAGYDIDMNKLRHNYRASGHAWFGAVRDYLYDQIGVCIECPWHGNPRGINRLIFRDPATETAGHADNGFGEMGLISLRHANMELIIHEMGHGWMAWPHSFTELPWQNGPPNPYSNRYDVVSQLADVQTSANPVPGWHKDMLPPLAINRYSAGWIDADEVALHVNESGTYRLSKPLDDGYQFLVIHSGRQYAFTTLEVLPERPAALVNERALTYDPSAPGERRRFRYDGVLVSRYDQSRGTGALTRFGPALHDARNPHANHEVNAGWDDYSLIGDGESREIGSSVTVSVSKNPDGSYDVAVSGGKVAAYEPWCWPISKYGEPTEYDTGCALDGVF